MMLFVKLFGHTDKPLEETIFSVNWVDNAVNGDIRRADGDMEIYARGDTRWRFGWRFGGSTREDYVAKDQ